MCEKEFLVVSCPDISCTSRYLSVYTFTDIKYICNEGTLQ